MKICSCGMKINGIKPRPITNVPPIPHCACSAPWDFSLRRAQANASLILRGIQQLITRMEDVVRSRAPLSAKNSDNLIAEILPLQTVEAIRNFDTLLHDTNEAVTQFVSFYIKLII